jgi:hypothetical protein
VAVAGLHTAEAERLQVADGGGTAMVPRCSHNQGQAG